MRPGGVALEDDLDELALQPVEQGVHVVDGGRLGGVVLDVGLDGGHVERLRLLGHLGDQAPQAGIETRARTAGGPPCRC